MEWDRRNETLRLALDFPQGTTVAEHYARIEAVRKEHAHTVTFVNETGGLTCVPYALGLANNPIYQVIAADFNREIFAGTDFIRWLLNGRLNKLHYPALGVLGLYFSGTIWRHVGLVSTPSRITSKWGAFPIYDHDFWEVPISYGDQLRFFKKPSQEDALTLFLDYSRFEGISDNDINDILAEVERAP